MGTWSIDNGATWWNTQTVSLDRSSPGYSCSPSTADSAVIVKALARVSKEIDPDNGRYVFAAGETV
jgi:hypothetical protein